MRTRIYKRIILSALIIGAGTILWANEPKKPVAAIEGNCKSCYPGYCGWPVCEREVEVFERPGEELELSQ